LSADAVSWIARAEQLLPAPAAAAMTGVEMAENIPAPTRTAHVEARGAIDPAAWVALAEGLTGLTVQGEAREATTIAGTPVVTDRLPVTAAPGAPVVALARHTTAFFQANRFLLPWFVQHVVGHRDGRARARPVRRRRPVSAWRRPRRGTAR
jgi:hypothetical protein